MPPNQQSTKPPPSKEDTLGRYSMGGPSQARPPATPEPVAIPWFHDWLAAHLERFEPLGLPPLDIPPGNRIYKDWAAAIATHRIDRATMEDAADQLAATKHDLYQHWPKLLAIARNLKAQPEPQAPPAERLQAPAAPPAEREPDPEPEPRGIATEKPIIRIRGMCEGYEVEIESRMSLASVRAACRKLAARGITGKGHQFEWTPQGLPICRKHQCAMTARTKQGDTWFSHNVGTEKQPIWCKGYHSPKDSPGFEVEITEQ